MNDRTWWPGVVSRGHGVASGSGDTPYPAGSIGLQTPHFAARGLDLTPYRAATLNVDLSPATWRMTNPRLTLTQVAWSDLIGAETFSFADVRLRHFGTVFAGLIYYPHPETKPQHFQSPSVVELLLPQVPGIDYGSTVEMWVDPEQVTIHS